MFSCDVKWLGSKLCPVVMCLLDVCFLTPTNSIFLKLLFSPEYLFCVCRIINEHWLLFHFRLFKSVTTTWGPRSMYYRNLSSGFSELPWTIQCCCHRVYSALFLGWNCKVLKRVYSLKNKTLSVMLAISSWQVADREKMFANPICDKGIVSRIHNSENSTVRKRTAQ